MNEQERRETRFALRAEKAFLERQMGPDFDRRLSRKLDENQTVLDRMSPEKKWLIGYVIRKTEKAFLLSLNVHKVKKAGSIWIPYSQVDPQLRLAIEGDLVEVEVPMWLLPEHKKELRK